LAKEIEERLPLASVYRDIPRGRKRAGWKAEFVEAIGEGAADLGEVREEDIFQAVKRQRKSTRSEPEITIAPETTSTSA
jgi:hypothetical protein